MTARRATWGGFVAVGLAACPRTGVDETDVADTDSDDADTDSDVADTDSDVADTDSDVADTDSAPWPWDDDPCARLGTAPTGFDADIARLAAAPAPTGGLVVAGSSTIRRWESAFRVLSSRGPVVQRGVGGASLRDVALRSDALVTATSPRGVVVFAGTNDVAGGATADAVVDAWRCLATRVHAARPGTPVWFVGITPTPARWASWGVAAEVNARVAADTALRPEWGYVDVPAAFLATGSPPDAALFVDDGLHLSPSGYTLFEGLVADAIAGLPVRPIATGAATEGVRRWRVDFGPSNPEDGWEAPDVDGFGIRWNAWSGATGGAQVHAGEALAGLVDTTGVASDVCVVVTGGFRANGLRNGGLTSPPGDRLGTLAVAEATADFFYTEGPDDPGGVALTGLDPARTYTLRLFASRASTDEVRRTRYVLRGGGPDASTTLVTTGADVGSGGYDGNNSEVAVLTGLVPDAWGQLHVDVERDLGRFAYLSLLELEQEP
jgi:lysophospholipase L1-like esterase